MASIAEEIQRTYYRDTAERYDELHVSLLDPHYIALAWLAGAMDHLGIDSVLDVGSGTGRAVAYIRQHRPRARACGVEPSPELRAVAATKGVVDLVDGDAMNLAFPDRSFDLVCEFGVLHHLPRPKAAVSEMLRVASKAVFISDDNHFAAGGALGQRVKRGLAAMGLWKTAYWLRSGGKGYRLSESDGLAYPYSVFDDLHLLHSACTTVHCMNTAGKGRNLYTGSGHIAALGIKR